MLKSEDRLPLITPALRLTAEYPECDSCAGPCDAGESLCWRCRVTARGELPCSECGSYCDDGQTQCAGCLEADRVAWAGDLQRDAEGCR